MLNGPAPSGAAVVNDQVTVAVIVLPAMSFTPPIVAV